MDEMLIREMHRLMDVENPTPAQKHRMRELMDMWEDMEERRWRDAGLASVMAYDEPPARDAAW